MTRRTTTVVLAGIGLVLAGCAGGTQAPDAATTVTVTATPGASSTPPTPTATPAAADVHLFTYLNAHVGYPNAAGACEYDQDRGDRELEVWATRLPGLAGRTLTVDVGSTRVGTMVVSTTGRAHGEWESEHGDPVPAAEVGDRVHVRTSDGAVVLSGQLKTDPAAGTHHRHRIG